MEGVSSCRNSLDADVVVFVSKMIPVRVAELSARDKNSIMRRATAEGATEAPEEVLMAFARVFSGVLSHSCSLHVLRNRTTAVIESSTVTTTTPSPQPPTLVTISGEDLGFYVCLGPSVFCVDEMPAGNIVGIVGLQDKVMKSATLSSNALCPPLLAMSFQLQPMVRVAVEPLRHQDLTKFESGLQCLYQYDPVVEISCDPLTGEHSIACLGELHLEQCLKALSERFAR